MKESLVIGQSAEIKRLFTEDDVDHFARLSGDNNPLHLDETYASQTRFKKRVVHGALVSSLFSNLLGTKCPGEGSIYCMQNTKFLKPVYLNETVTARVTIDRIDEGKQRVYLKTQAFNEQEQLVIDGEAMILYEGENNGKLDE